MQKGQTSFELIFLALVVISAAAFITTIYIQTNENTTIISLTKNELLKELTKSNSNNLIESIKFEKNQAQNTQTIKVKILSNNLTETEKLITPIFINDLNLRIQEKLKITNLNIDLNITSF